MGIGGTMIMVNKIGAVAMVAMTLTLAACTSSVSPATTTTTRSRTQTEAHPRVTWDAVTGASGILWLLGSYRCSTGINGMCYTIMRSTNGGASFSRMLYPSTSPPSVKAGDQALSFANAEDGYLYVSYLHYGLYWTGDGGKVWRLTQPGGRAAWRGPELGGPLLSQIVTTNGRSYVLVYEGCSQDQCASIDLAASADTSDTWTDTRLELTVDSLVSIAAFGQKVWLIVTSGGGSTARMLVSDDAGKHFASLPSTGMLGQACNATATSATTLWGFCIGGHSGYAVHSTDGGRVFASLPGQPGASNAGDILPVSGTTAIFQNGDRPNVWLTRDGGQHFTSVLRSRNLSSSFDVAVASTTTWLALEQSPTGVNNMIWRTTDAGRSWQQVKLPGL